MRLGYFALGLITFRYAWGFVGTRYARFSSFVSAPWSAAKELPDLFHREPSSQIGHSKLGGWSILVLLVLVTIQATTGLFLTDDIFYSGPYNPAVSGDTAGLMAQIHRINFQVLQGFVVLHLLVIGWYAMGKRTNLVLPMLTGHKATQADQAISGHKVALAVALIIAVCFMVWLMLELAPEPVYAF